MDAYYDTIAPAYDELHEAEQLKKLDIIKEELKKAKININTDTKLLDIGCGTGISSQFDCDVTGIDPSEELLKIAEKRLPAAQFFQQSAEALDFDDNEFDVVISLTAIQNFENLEKGLSEIKRVGKSYAISYLKKSNKADEIDSLITKLFKGLKIKKIEEDKDIIFIINK